MTSIDARIFSTDSLVPTGYALIFASALGFDLFTDRSFGALMLSVLPISFVAFCCLLVGPWLDSQRKLVAGRNWFIGAMLVLVISIIFVSLGPDQAKTGELIFAYAALIMGLPATLVLPIVEPLMEPMFAGRTVTRLVGSWIICVVAGWIEWQALSWLCKVIRRHETS